MNAGTIHKVYYKEEDVCQVGQLFLEIDTDSTEHQKPDNSVPSSESTTTASPKPAETITPNPEVVSS